MRCPYQAGDRKGGYDCSKKLTLTPRREEDKKQTENPILRSGGNKNLQGGGGSKIKEVILSIQMVWYWAPTHSSEPTPTESVSTAQDVEISVAAALTILPLHIILP